MANRAAPIFFELPDKVETIGYEAFRDCVSLTEVLMPESLNTIEYSAFESCTSLTDISLPEDSRPLRITRLRVVFHLKSSRFLIRLPILAGMPLTVAMT